MKRPWLIAALALLAVSNVWVLIHVARNRAGSPDAELELTARELVYYGGRSEDSGVVLMLRWQNPAPEYEILGIDWPGWFDRKKLEELGFDVQVPANAKGAARHYQNQRSREVFVALEFDGPAWQGWLKMREPRLHLESRYNQELSVEQRLEVERQTESRLVAVDAGLDAAALRRKYPDRRHVMIMPGLARAIREDARKAVADDPGRPAGVRGAITRVSIEAINVPQPFSRFFDDHSSYAPWTYEQRELKILLPPYAVTLRVGSLNEPWVTNVNRLR
jgi:hypothetical protein